MSTFQRLEKEGWIPTPNEGSGETWYRVEDDFGWTVHVDLVPFRGTPTGVIAVYHTINGCCSPHSLLYEESRLFNRRLKELIKRSKK